MRSKPDLSAMADAWPSPFVARDRLEIFSGGILTSRTMANLDSRGEGVPGRIRIGRKVVYPVKSLIEWLEARGQVLSEKV